MKMVPLALGTTGWSTVEPTEHAGETDIAIWRTRCSGDESDHIRARMVEYTPGCLVDYWCRKGHTLFCLDGELEIILEDDRAFMPTPGMSYQMGDDVEAHQSTTKKDARLLIID